ncbi:hypothetical protein NKG05_18830 [Oerskovia sp. M15]
MIIEVTGVEGEADTDSDTDIDTGASADRVSVRRLHDAASRWTVLREAGAFGDDLLTTLPVEQRHAGWSLLWALPRVTSAAGVAVLHAPRRPTSGSRSPPCSSRPSPGPRSSPRPAGSGHGRARGPRGESYARLLARHAEAAHLSGAVGDDHVLRLVPTGLPAGRSTLVSGRWLSTLCGGPAARAGPARPGRPGRPERSGRSGARRTPPRHASRYIALARGRPGAPESPHLVAPSDAQVLAGEVGRDPEVVRVLGRAVPDLVDVPSPLLAVARSLGVRPRDLADVLDELPAGIGPAGWREVYGALAPHTGQPGSSTRSAR